MRRFITTIFAPSWRPKRRLAAFLAMLFFSIQGAGLAIGMTNGAIGTPWGSTLLLVVVGGTLFGIAPIGWIALFAWAFAHLERHEVAGSEPRCARCQYPRPGLPSDVCPECGGTAFTRSTMLSVRPRALIAGIVLVLLITVPATETLRVLDERSFMREAPRHGATYARGRWWPATKGGLIYNTSRVPPFWCND